MKAYEIEGWIEKKIRREKWIKGDYIRRSPLGTFNNMTTDTDIESILRHFFEKNDWEEYKETKKVKLFRYTFQWRTIIKQGEWTNEDWDDFINVTEDDEYDLLKTEEKTVEL